MNYSQTLERLPAHLRQYVVQQDYEAYDAIDQCVWRFVLLQTYNQLKRTAHPAYINGLAQTGISVERIPRIEEMDACLNRFGWGAVCVDGFIPPRAFQEFQSLGIMTIATEIRTAAHLAYTPAPDIIHESAGHSPIIPDPEYRHFLQRFGEVGKRAFASHEDLAVYNAIRNLSEVKEDPSSTPADIDLAEHSLIQALDSVTFITEAALMSRLHWWTVEYGLVGTPSDYKIYGAGLLSSVGESYFCHDPKIRKIPLTADCIQVGYDITKPQPQLFVAHDFQHLNQVLDEVAEGLAFKVGGLSALEKAQKSSEVGTVVLNSGLQIMGVLSQFLVENEQLIFAKWDGPCALGYDNQTLESQSRDNHAHGFSSPFGPLKDGSLLAQFKAVDLQQRGWNVDQRIQMEFASGIQVQGLLKRTQFSPVGNLLVLTLVDAKVWRGSDIYYLPEWGSFDMAVGEKVTSAFAGPADISFWPATEFPQKTVPKPKKYNSADKALLKMYEEAMDLWRHHSFNHEKVIQGFDSIDQKLDEQYSEEWLLRWNLLESLKKMDRGVMLCSHLKNKLLEIEERHYQDAPITMGLKYLGFIEKAEAEAVSTQ